MTDFFKQLVGLAGYGLIGVAIIMVIVIAYVVIKKPNNKFAILILVGFCMFVMCLFTYAGVGVVKENDKLQDSNKTLTNTTQKLSNKNEELTDSVQITKAKLNITSLQYTTLKDQNLSRDSLTKIANSIARNLDTLSVKDKSFSKAEWINLSNQYKDISEKLNKNEFNTNEAKIQLLKNNEKSPILEKVMKPSMLPKQ